MKNIVIGQECICPDGMGRVVNFNFTMPHEFIKVDTYINNRGCEWAPHNVKLIKYELVEVEKELSEAEEFLRFQKSLKYDLSKEDFFGVVYNDVQSEAKIIYSGDISKFVFTDGSTIKFNNKYKAFWFASPNKKGV